MKSTRRATAGWLLGLTAILAVCIAGWYGLAQESRTAENSSSAAVVPVNVDIVTPRAGGLDRLCTQPGSLEAFQSADVFAKVSGFLVEQAVDIGSTVREGDILARLSVPEYEKQVKQDEAEVEQSRAKVEQMVATIASAEADLGTATIGIALAKAESKSKVSFRAYREKQRERIRDLIARMAVDVKLGDEQEDQYQAAVSAELAAEESVNLARQKEVSALARLRQAKTDMKFAESQVLAAKAKLEKSQAILNYSVIRSPYTGVVTKRNFHPGDFIRSADSGGDRVPLLAVERTDVMRVVIQVPERDVPFVDIGDPAVVQLDALSRMIFQTTGSDKVAISCFSASEDPHTRMMRVEVHLKNPTGTLRRGMYGRVTLLLQTGIPSAVRIPSSAIQGKAEGGRAIVRVVRNNLAELVPVQYGADNGIDVEILSGLSPTDRVIVRASGAIENGTPVNMGTTIPTPSH